MSTALLSNKLYDSHLSSSGYGLDHNAVLNIFREYPTNYRFTFDDFVARCVSLKPSTGMCRHEMPSWVLGSSESTLRKSPSSFVEEALAWDLSRHRCSLTSTRPKNLVSFTAFLLWNLWGRLVARLSNKFRVGLLVHGGGGPHVVEVTRFGGATRLSI